MDRLIVPAKTKRDIAEAHGHSCCFPECKEALASTGSSFIGEISAIEAISPYGPRFNPSKSKLELLREENFVLLCPNHHALIDRYPEKYNKNWLENARNLHLSKINSIIQKKTTSKVISIDKDTRLSLKEALDVWSEEKINPSEEFWQRLFENCPEILSQLYPQSMCFLDSKCYVGGKNIANAGGNIVDFIYANNFTGSVSLIEIKTPCTRILGSKYRANAYSISDEMSGALVQVLNYKDQMTKEYYSLSHGEDGTTFTVFNPKCLIICGSMEVEFDLKDKYKSFELFRSSLNHVDIITFDEVFRKVNDIFDLFS